jgi:hypothetical protein
VVKRKNDSLYRLPPPHPRRGGEPKKIVTLPISATFVDKQKKQVTKLQNEQGNQHSNGNESVKKN